MAEIIELLQIILEKSEKETKELMEDIILEMNELG